MKIYPYNPSEFSVEFVKRMRKHPDIIQMPSLRQVQTIPQLLLARFLRKGKVSVKDYIEIAVASSFPINQDLAKKVSFQILFPNYSIRDIDSFFEYNAGAIEQGVHFPVISEQDYESQQIQHLCDEIKFSTALNFITLSKVEEFVEWVIQKRYQEPYKSILVFFKNTSEFYAKEIISTEELLILTKQKVIDKINSLKPCHLITINKLGFNHLVEKFSRKKWEKITNKALSGNKIDRELKVLKRKGSFDDFIKTIKYLKETEVLKARKYSNLKKDLSHKIKTLEHVYYAALELNEIAEFNLNQVLLFSIHNLSLDLILKIAKSLDQYFGTNLRKLLFELLNKESYKSRSFKSKIYEENNLLETINKYAFKSPSWLFFFEKVLFWKMNNAKNTFRSHEEFKILTHKILQFTHSCENIYCSQKISRYLSRLSNLTIESCIVPTELKDVVEFLNKIGLKPDNITVKKIGEKIEMPEEEIAELIEPAYEALKKYVKKSRSSLEKIQELINKVKYELNFEKILELIKLALGSDNRDALAALAHFNLEQALEAAKSVKGKQGMEKIISCLKGGGAESLIKQWFLHRDKIPIFLKDKIKEIAKYMLIELGIIYSRSYLGSFTSGIIQTNLNRPYEIGDAFEDIDLESTIYNLLEKGKNVDHITYDDFYVNISTSDQRSVCIEMDISESMTGEKLAYMAICVTMLVYSIRNNELGIVLFEKDTHVLKEFNQKVDLEELADNLLSMRSKGTTFVEKALQWARDQFKNAYKSRHKINIMFSDAEIYDIPNAAKILRVFKSLGVDFILVCPEKQYNMRESEKILKLAGGQLLTVKNWEDFPKLITNIINTRF